MKSPRLSILLTHLDKPHAILFLLPVLLYAKTLNFEFIPSWDDAEYVLNNPYIKGLKLENLWGAFANTFVSNYSPLHIISYMLDYAVWGLNPKGFHLSNVLLHAANSVLIYKFINITTQKPRLSFYAALIFAVHPLNVENVAWVSERKTLLATFFSLTSILTFLQYQLSSRIKYYVYAILLFLFALLSKPVVVVLPLILTSFVICFSGKSSSIKKLLPIAPFYIVAAIMAVLTISVHTGTNAIESENLSPEILLGTIYPTMLPVYWEYIRLIIFPVRLSGFYDATLYYWTSPEVVASLLAWLLVLALVLWKGSPQTRFWFFWFWIWLLPVSNILPLQVYYADRYMYLPAVGGFCLCLLMAEKLLKDKLLKFAATGLILYFLLFTINRIPVWANEVVFWEDAVVKSPGRAKVHYNLGYAYDVRGRYAEAAKEYLAAAKIYPDPNTVLSYKIARQKSLLQDK